VEAELLSMNSMGAIAAGRAGYKYRGYRRRCESWITGLDATPATGKRRLVITRYWAAGCRAFDFVNLVGGCKPLVDAIKCAGWLRDDTPRWVDDWYKQVKSDDGIARVGIELSELEDQDRG
jgi:hypothetical protein